MSKLNVADNLYLGTPEIARLQELLDNNRSNVQLAIVKNLGLILQQLDASTYSNDWKPSYAGLVVTVQAGNAIVKDANGAIRSIISGTSKTVTVPSGDGTYNVLVEYSATTLETGTLQATNGSTAIVGSGTSFTKLFKANRSVILDNTAYAVASVTDDTHLTLVSPYGGTTGSGKTFETGGWFSVVPPVAQQKIYAYDGFTLSATLSAPSSTQYKIAQVVVSAGAITSLTDKRTDNIFALQGIDLTTLVASGTKATDFRVGVGALNGGAGYPVLLNYGVTPPTPFRVRVVDVDAVRPVIAPSDGISANIPLSVQTGVHLNQANVTFKWGYDDLTGSVSVDVFTINNSAYAANGFFASNELAGYWVWIQGTSYKIASNTATASGVTTLTLLNADGMSPNLTLTVTSANPAILHNNSDYYQLALTPYAFDGTTLNTLGMQVLKVHGDDTKPRVSVVQTLMVGQKYQIRVRALNNDNSGSAWVTMPAGTFTKYAISNLYTNPYIVQMPQIAANGTIDLVATAFGFRATVGGWTDATDFEFVYAVGVAADFTSASQVHKITSDRTLGVATPSADTYYVAVRPLIGGQAVCAAVTKSIVSGGGGYLPTDSVAVHKEVFMLVMTGNIGTVATIATGDYTIIVNTLVSSGASLGSLESAWVGSIVKDSAGNEYQIVRILDTLKAEVVATSSTPVAPAVGAFTLGQSELGRDLIDVKNISLPYRLTRVVFECDWLESGGSAILRWYQNTASGKAKADTLVANAMGSTFSADTDVEINAADGTLDLRVDAYDSGNNANNLIGFVGVITVYGRPLFIRDKDSR